MQSRWMGTANIKETWEAGGAMADLLNDTETSNDLSGINCECNEGMFSFTLRLRHRCAISVICFQYHMMGDSEQLFSARADNFRELSKAYL